MAGYQSSFIGTSAPLPPTGPAPPAPGTASPQQSVPRTSSANTAARSMLSELVTTSRTPDGNNVIRAPNGDILVRRRGGGWINMSGLDESNMEQAAGFITKHGANGDESVILGTGGGLQKGQMSINGMLVGGTEWNSKYGDRSFGAGGGAKFGIAGPAAQQPNQLPVDPFGYSSSAIQQSSQFNPQAGETIAEDNARIHRSVTGQSLPQGYTRTYGGGGGSGGGSGTMSYSMGQQSAQQPGQQQTQPQLDLQQLQPSSTDQPGFTPQQPQQLGILAKQGSTAPAGTIDFSAGTIALQQRKYPSMGAF